MFTYYLGLAWRSLRLHKMLTAMMALALAVGIGACMTTLTVAHVLAGDPVPTRSATLYLAQVNPTLPPKLSRATTSAMDYRSATDLWSTHHAARQAMIANSPVRVNVPGTGRSPLARQLLLTTSDFFPMFDVPFRYGGAWSPADEASRAPVVVISAALNQRLFGDVDSVGRDLLLDGVQVRVVGVLAPWRPVPRFYDVWDGRGMQGKTGGFYQDAEDVYLPFSTGLDVFTGPPPTVPVRFCWSVELFQGPVQSAPCAWVSLWVQLPDAGAVRDYAGFLANYARRQRQAGRYQSDQVRLVGLLPWLEWNRVVPGSVRMQAWMALAFLLICMVNTMGLLLSKFMRRAGEIGVRRAMGASRLGVFAQCLTEASMVGLAGGVGGWLLTLAGLWLVRRQPVAYADLAHLDLPMFAGTFALSVAASLLAGVLPALRASRVPIGLQLKTL